MRSSVLEQFVAMLGDVIFRGVFPLHFNHKYAVASNINSDNSFHYDVPEVSMIGTIIPRVILIPLREVIAVLTIESQSSA